MTKVAVTAASGRLGQRILRELVAEIGSDEVVGIARSPDRISVSGIEVRSGDYASPEEMKVALEGIDSAVVVSTPVGPEDRERLHRNVIAAACAAGVRKALYTSVIGNGLENDTWYAPLARINRQAEEDLRESGLEWIVARNGLYIELDVDAILRAADDGVFRNNGGDGRCGYISWNELAFATAKLATDDSCNGRIYNLVGECHSQPELVELVNLHFDQQIRYETISDGACFDKLESARGPVVARMLAGCYQCIRIGAFDVPSDFESASGRPAKPIDAQVAAYQAVLQQGAGV